MAIFEKVKDYHVAYPFINEKAERYFQCHSYNKKQARDYEIKGQNIP